MTLTTLHYATLHCTTLITLHYTTTTTTQHYTNYTAVHHNYNYTTLHQTTLHYTTLHYTTLHHITLHYTTLITPHHDYNCNCTCKYTNYTTLQHSSTTLHYTTATTATATLQLHPLHHTTSSSCGKVTTATIAAIPKNTNPITCPSISGLALPSVIHNKQPLL